MKWVYSVVFVFLLAFGSNYSAVSGSTAVQTKAKSYQSGANYPVKLVSGKTHNCVLMSDGSIKCWGNDLSGQLGLGDGLFENHSNALAVPAITGAKSLALGNQNTCALTATGGILCWGDNGNGELGNDPVLHPDSLTPIAVVGLTKAIADISAFESNYCALDIDGGILCWGIMGTFTPTYVTGLTSGFSKVAAGRWHTCALNTSGEIYCWGDNSAGQLGVGVGDQTIPVKLSGLSAKAIDIASGDLFSCAVLEGGAVQCWGKDTHGQLGSTPGTIQYVPLTVNGIGGVNHIFAGLTDVCALTTANLLYCWGQNNFSQLGNGEFVDSATPLLVNLGPIVPLSAALGTAHTCVLAQDQKVYCWGSNINGQVGDSAPMKNLLPFTANGFENGASLSVSAISLAMNQSCALKNDGTGYCWGMNFSGELGNHSLIASAEPVQIQSPGTQFVQFSASDGFSCGLTTEGGVKCWGEGQSNQLGNDYHASLDPVDVVGLGAGSGVTSIGSNTLYSCALTATHQVKCWGAAHDFLEVVIASGALQLATSGTSHGSACARMDNGSVQCWGENFTPAVVPGFETGIQQISVMFNRLCGMTASGVTCNDDITNANSTNYSIPSLTRSDVKTFAAGWTHYCYIDTQNGVKCAGDNRWGQLGDGTTTNRTTPDYVMGLNSGVTALMTHWNRVCAVKDGAIYCWGDASKGALGDGLPLQRTFPVEVVGINANPVLTLNYKDAKPGSMLRLVGANFAPNANYQIRINGQQVGQGHTNGYGVFMLLLNTTLGGQGLYNVDAQLISPTAVNLASLSSAATVTLAQFNLNPTGETRPKEGSAAQMAVPANSGFTSFLFMPLLSR